MKRYLAFWSAIILCLTASLTAFASDRDFDYSYDGEGFNSFYEDSVKGLNLAPTKEKSKNFSPAKPLPKLTGNQAHDFVNVALSQLGYKHSSTKETVYSDWAGQKSAPWCSEFVSWCAYKAGISPKVIPVKIAAIYFREFYVGIGQYYVLDNGISHEDCAYNDSSIPTISPKDIRRGDIILMDSGKDPAEPVHTCIALSVDGNKITTIDGNIGGVVKKGSRSISKVHGVCRPAFNKCKQHSYNEGVVTKKPTCKETGIKTYTCVYCGETKKDSIKTLSHSYSEYKTVKPATTTAMGVKERTCKICGKTEKATIPKLSNNIKLNYSGTVKIVEKDTISLKITEKPAGDSVKSVKSSNRSVASVTNKGVVTGLKKGTSIITVTLKSGKKSSFKLVVT